MYYLTPAEDFSKFNPPSRLDFQSLWPPLLRDFPESHLLGACGFFLEQPNHYTGTQLFSVFYDLIL